MTQMKKTCQNTALRTIAECLLMSSIEHPHGKAPLSLLKNRAAPLLSFSAAMLSSAWSVAALLEALREYS